MTQAANFGTSLNLSGFRDISRNTFSTEIEKVQDDVKNSSLNPLIQLSPLHTSPSIKEE